MKPQSYLGGEATMPLHCSLKKLGNIANCLFGPGRRLAKREDFEGDGRWCHPRSEASSSSFAAVRNCNFLEAFFSDNKRVNKRKEFFEKYITISKFLHVFSYAV